MEKKNAQQKGKKSDDVLVNENPFLVIIRLILFYVKNIRDEHECQLENRANSRQLMFQFGLFILKGI